MNRLVSVISLNCLSIILVACGGGGSSVAPAPAVPPPQGLLKQVESPLELEQSIKSGFTIQREEQLFPEVLAAAASGNFTGTYTQEVQVDEFDAVKYDGSNLYVAPRRYFSCCFFAPIGAREAGDPPERSIRILATDPASGTASLASEIPLEDNVSVQGMYVVDDRMVALTGTSVYGQYGGMWANVFVWAPEQLGFNVYDMSDPAAPALEVEASIDGVFVESRRIGNTIYIVSRYAPWIDGLDYSVATAEQQVNNETVLNGVALGDLLPQITISGVSRPLVEAEDCYIASDEDDPGYPVLTSITAVPLDDPAAFSTTCYNQEAYGAYVSENAIYFTQTQADEEDSQFNTLIHKFALQGTAVEYRGSGEVDGQVWRGGQADFRISEYDGDLRILASEFDWNGEDRVDHKLFVMREAAGRPELEIVAELPNVNRPKEIGKPNESLYGVRFLGDRAYAVTFEQIDPLYAIDLSDPTDPFVAGELEVTGFSDFLHPVSDDLLLGLGVEANGGVKLELFDVTDLAQPVSRGSMGLGGSGSYSEARYDRHAFNYQVGENGTDRFAIPAEVYSEDGSFSHVDSGLYLFEIRDRDQAALASLISAGAIIPPADPDRPWVSRSRSFLHDDTVYYIRDETVWSAFWNAPTMINGPF